MGVAGVGAMDDAIQGEKPKPKDELITAQKPSEPIAAQRQENPFKLPDKDMGPVRKTIMIVGFICLLFLGERTTHKFRHHPLEEIAFLIGSVAYFAWLAPWVTWKRPCEAEAQNPFKRRESKMELVRRGIIIIVYLLLLAVVLRLTWLIFHHE